MKIKPVQIFHHDPIDLRYCQFYRLLFKRMTQSVCAFLAKGGGVFAPCLGLPGQAWGCIFKGDLQLQGVTLKEIYLHRGVLNLITRSKFKDIAFNMTFAVH